MKKALVFGGNGFLGSFVVKELCLKNFQVVILARNEGDVNDLKTLGFPGQIVFKKFNAASENALQEINFEGCDFVANLIGIGASTKKNSYTKVHVEFPTKLAEITAKKGIKFAHVSAFTGEGEDAVKIQSEYVLTKREGEVSVLKHNPKAIVVRPTVMLGEGGSFVQTFEKIIAISPIVPIINGKAKINPVYAGDVAKFIVATITHSEFEGKACNLAGKEVILFRDLVENIAGFMDKKRIFIPVPFFLANFGLTIKQFLPSFVFRTSITKDILFLSKYEMIVKNNSLLALIPTPTKIETILSHVLAKYKLYD